MPGLTLPDISEYEGRGGKMEARKVDLSKRWRARKLPHPSSQLMKRTHADLE